MVLVPVDPEVLLEPLVEELLMSALEEATWEVSPEVPMTEPPPGLSPSAVVPSADRATLKPRCPAPT